MSMPSKPERFSLEPETPRPSDEFFLNSGRQTMEYIGRLVTPNAVQNYNSGLPRMRAILDVLLIADKDVEQPSANELGI